MRDIDSLLTAYRTDPSKLDTLLAAATRYATAIARSEGHDDPEDIGQRATIQLWHHHRRITSSARWWLAQTTKRIIIDDARAASTAKRQNEMVAPVEDRDDWHLDALPEDMRQIAELLQRGYNRTEIASRLRISRRELYRRIGDHVDAAAA